MSDIRGVGLFEWVGSSGYLAARNIESEPLTQCISDRQMKLFLTLLAQIERAIAEPGTSAHRLQWLEGYLAGWTTPLLEVRPGPTARPEETETYADRSGRLSPSENNADDDLRVRPDSNAEFPSVSSSNAAKETTHA